MHYLTKCLAFAVTLIFSTLSMVADTFDYGTFTYEVISYENLQCRLIGANQEISGEITIPNTVPYTFIPEGHTETMTYDMAVTEIGNEAFSYDSKIKTYLTKVTLGLNIITIGEEAFNQNKSLEEVVLNYGLVTIGKHAFAGCNLLSIDMPDTVVEIGKGAFAWNEKLESINLSHNLTSIPESCFSGCKNILDITMPDGLKEIEAGAFSSCTLLQSITLNEGLQRIGEMCFNSCENLLYIYLPETIKDIEEATFRLCSALESVSLGSNVQNIGRLAFSECINLQKIHIPLSVKNIGDYAFERNSSLSEVTGCEGLESIGNSAFSNLGQHWWTRGILTSFPFQQGLKEIGENAFSYNSLEEISLPSSVIALGSYVFFDNSNLKTLTLSDNLEVIPESMCEKCTKLDSVIVPDATTVIEDKAFYRCGLNNVVIGSGMTKIKPDVFKDVSMKAIECKGLVPPTVFLNTFTDWQFENTTLIVPEESIADYGSKPYWKNFLNMVTNGVDAIHEGNSNFVRYDLNGRIVDDNFKGVTINRYSDGTTKKRLNH